MTKKLFLFSLSFGFAASAGAKASSCLEDIARVMDSGKTVPVSAEKTAATLGRSLKEKELASLNEVRGLAGTRSYTASEILAQDKHLMKSGFKQAEIERLRKENVLTNNFVSVKNGAPVGLETQKISLREIATADVKNLKEGQKLQYVIDHEGGLFVNSEMTRFSPDKVIMGLEGPAGHETSRIIREAGEITYGKNGFVFKPVYGFDTTAVETKKITSEMARLSPGEKVSHPPTAQVPQARAIKCLDILSSQTNGKNFVLNRMLADNVVTVGAIGVGEATGAGRMQTEKGREVIYADLIGSNITGYLGGKIGRNLALKNDGLMAAMTTRAGVGMGMVEIQKGVHETLVEGDSQQTAEDIASFNRAHFIARLPLNHAIDQFMVKQLPVMIFNSCLKNPGTSVFISPTAVRFYERLGSNVIYYGARQAVIGN